MYQKALMMSTEKKDLRFNGSPGLWYNQFLLKGRTIT
jgi:hypothetical protein